MDFITLMLVVLSMPILGLIFLGKFTMNIHICFCSVDYDQLNSLFVL